jgi:hypothetical protein
MTRVLIIKVSTPVDQNRRDHARASSSPIHPVLAHLAAAADLDRLTGTGVLAALAKLPDPQAGGVCDTRLVRTWCWRSAVLAGCRLITTIGQWMVNASAQFLAH